MKTLSRKRTKATITLYSCLFWILCTVAITALFFMVSSTSAYAGQVTLGWDKSAEADVAGYKIYYGTASRNYTQSVKVSSPNITTCTIINLLNGQKYYFAATAYNAELIESDYSSEVYTTITPVTTSVPATTTTVRPTTTTTYRVIKSLTMTAPNGGESWQRNSSKNISWSHTGNLASLKITLWQNGRFIGTIANNVSPAAGSYSWIVSICSGRFTKLGTGYSIKIQENGTSLSDTSDGQFSIVKIQITAPNWLRIWRIGTTQNITWEDKFIDNNLRIMLFKDGVKVGNIVDSISPSAGSYAWTVGQYAGGTAPAGTGYQIQVQEIGTEAVDRSDRPFALRPFDRIFRIRESRR
jgi:hypothetical protein